MARTTTFLDRVIDAAQRHGEESEADHEVGDLQMLAWKLWAVLTPAQRKVIAMDEDLNDLIIWWNDALAPGAV